MHRATGPGARPATGARSSASLVQRIVQNEILRGVSDPRVRGLVTVLGVDLAADHEDATVRVSVLPAEFGPLAVQGLNHGAAHLRQAVLKGSRIRHAPRLRFALDDSLKRAAALESAMREAAADAGSGGAADEGAPGDDGTTE